MSYSVTYFSVFLKDVFDYWLGLFYNKHMNRYVCSVLIICYNKLDLARRFFDFDVTRYFCCKTLSYMCTCILKIHQFHVKFDVNINKRTHKNATRVWSYIKNILGASPLSFLRIILCKIIFLILFLFLLSHRSRFNLNNSSLSVAFRLKMYFLIF